MLWRAFTLLVLLPISASAASTAITESGALRGAHVDGLNIYKGIPYAAPPLGDLRWRAPDPVKPWTGIRDATEFAPACMQKGVSMPGETPPTVSEDCLYLNIWAPTGKRLPVIVWIHGGGYKIGFDAPLPR